MTIALPLADLEQVYDALADAIDHAGADSERFLAKLALLLAQEVGNGARVQALIAVAAADLQAAATDRPARTEPHGLTHLGRLTANLFRPVPLGTLRMVVHTDQLGRNAGHFSASLLAGDKELGRFTALLQRETAVPLPDGLAGHPLPQLLPAPDDARHAKLPFSGQQTGYGELVETRVARGKVFDGPSAVWFRLRHPLVRGEAPTGNQRVAAATNSGNGVSVVLGFRRYSFVNADLTLHLLRLAVGAWVGLDARTHLSEHGCGLAESALFDVQGLIGRATQSRMVRPRARD